MADILQRVKDVQNGRTVRKSYARHGEVIEMPNLIEVQKNSYRWFLETGLKDVFSDVAGITDYSGNLELRFADYTLENTPKYSVEECKERDATYAAPLKVKVRLRNRETEEIKEQEIFMGDFPLMTPGGTFVINGAERVIISQIVRSPGVYFNVADDKGDTPLYASTIIPYRGAWLEYETDLAGVMYVRIDKNRKIPVTALVRAIGVKTNAAIKELFGEDKILLATLDKDGATTEEESLLEVYRRVRPGEPPTEESARTLINNLFFDARRYDLSNVGRYKFNKKLALAPRLAGRKLSRPVSDPLTGEILADEGTLLTRDSAGELERRGVTEAWIFVEDEARNEREVKVFSNGMVDMAGFVDFDPMEIGVKEKVSFAVLREITSQFEGAALKEALVARMGELVPKHITREDILASVGYMLGLPYNVGHTDDIDHLGNRRLRSVGELLQNQFRIGFARMERVIRERMTIQDTESVTPQSLINIRPVTAAIKEFFGSSPLSQFMDQNNPLAELTHKRRMSALGPGGLTRDRASYDVRDVHYSHYGRMCPIETPEGPNIGLISYLSTYARINEYGFIEAPYRRYDKKKKIATADVVYMTADMEDDYTVAQAGELNENGVLNKERVSCRRRNELIEVEPEKVDFIDVSPKMMVSVATAMIPFLENDDCTRALMGSNMQKQAVPLIQPEAPIVGTGIEFKAAVDSGVCVIARGDGTVTSVSANEIVINYKGEGHFHHRLTKFVRSNQGTCVNQRPIVSAGDVVRAGDVIADGPSTSEGEISLGRNVLVGFMVWEGYNYEDAILLSERLVHDDVFTSIHIEEHELESRDTKLGPEEITRDIPNVGEDAMKDLDERGIIRIGAEVRTGDILVGKVTPKGETELTAEERLLRAIFGEKAREVRDTSLRVPHGESGIIVDVKVFSRENGDELSPGVNMVVRCYIAQKRKISVGDKMAGRHGNKGVISRILPREDMPFLPDGTPLDIVLNPLGVPGRMNIGQVLEIHLGYAAKALNWKIATPVFDGANEQDIEDTLELAGLSPDGKSELYDGRTGDKFDNPVTVGYSYYLKLHHLVDDKIHARSTGPYSLVTQQPLGGKAQFGGQRFGEMEVWALEAYGAAYTLQEILTVKSDDIVGRVKTYEAIVKGHNVPEPGIPESFKVLIKELQSLGLDMRVLDKNMEEIILREEDEDTSFGSVERSDEYAGNDNDFERAGFAVRTVERIDEFEEDEEDTEDEVSGEESDDDYVDELADEEPEDFKEEAEEEDLFS